MSYKLFAAGLFATVGVIGTVGAPAQAASLSCDAGNATAIDLDDDSYPYTACAGSYSGNDTGSQSTFLDDLNGGQLFQEVASWDNSWDWVLSGKSDDGNDSFTADNGLTEGTWSLNQAIEGPFIISFKASNSYSAYYFEDLDTAILSGTFTTDGVSVNGRGNAQALSHASLWTVNNYSDTPDTQEVPEPGTLLGFLTLGGVVFGKKVMGRNS